MRTKPQVFCEQCGREILPEEIDAGDVFFVDIGRKSGRMERGVLLDDICTTCYLMYMKVTGPLVDQQKYTHEEATEEPEGTPNEVADDFFNGLEDTKELNLGDQSIKDDIL